MYRNDRHFYSRTVQRLHKELNIPDDVCFVYVQHAFSPSIEYYNSINDRLAAVILKQSTAQSNPSVVNQLKHKFPNRIFSDITRSDLRSPEYAIDLLKRVTSGRRFAILEYGAYFAPAAQAICNDPQLGPKFLGVVEGTENGIRGSDDGCMPGYSNEVRNLDRPLISKSKSSIKSIMDMDIGPAIVQASNNILRYNNGVTINNYKKHVGVIGLGSIGRGVLSALQKLHIKPKLNDTNLATMAEFAHRQYQVTTQAELLENCMILFLNTGSCFLSDRPELLSHLSNNALLILCTSGDVEAGIPQLIKAGHLRLLVTKSKPDIATFATRYGTQIRIMLATDGIGQAPNMTLEDGSDSAVNKMSDMEFYALGAYLSSKNSEIPLRKITESPSFIQNIILEEWLHETHPTSIERKKQVPLKQVPILVERRRPSETAWH